MTEKLSFWKNLLGYLGAADETVMLEPSRKLRLSGKRSRIPLSGSPIFEVELGKQRLHLSRRTGAAQNLSGDADQCAPVPGHGP
jgi:hypothetical protein